MPKQSESWKLWTQGLDAWRHERLNDAADAFREAIARAQPDDVLLVEYHHSLGHLLDDLGAATEAQEALEKALQLACERNPDNSSMEVVMARCFLAEHFVRVLRFRDAIKVTEPSISAGAQALLFCVRARAYHGLGDLDRAQIEAERAIEMATSPEEREKIARDLNGVTRPLI